MAINNKDVEVLSEALFCYYFAIYKNNKQKEYNFSEWARIKTKNDLLSFTGKYGITHIVKHVNDDPAFVSRIPKVVEFLVNRKSFWANALKSQMEESSKRVGELSDTTTQLRQILSSSQARGQWG